MCGAAPPRPPYTGGWHPGYLQELSRPQPFPYTGRAQTALALGLATGQMLSVHGEGEDNAHCSIAYYPDPPRTQGRRRSCSASARSPSPTLPVHGEGEKTSGDRRIQQRFQPSPYTGRMNRHRRSRSARRSQPPCTGGHVTTHIQWRCGRQPPYPGGHTVFPCLQGDEFDEAPATVELAISPRTQGTKVKQRDWRVGIITYPPHAGDEGFAASSAATLPTHIPRTPGTKARQAEILLDDNISPRVRGDERGAGLIPCKPSRRLGHASR